MKAKQILSILVIATGLSAISWWNISTNENSVKIGIIQTASHPALDALRESFISELEEKLEKPVTWIIQNAEGSMSQLATITKSYSADSQIQIIFAIGTPAAQMVNQMAPTKTLLYAAISDPSALNFGLNACGTSDRLDVAAQAKLIQELLPEAKKVAILLNPSEYNSVVQVKAMEQALSEIGLVSLRIGVHSQTDIVAAVISAKKQADIILVPADNLLVSAMPLLAKAALRNHIPLIASDTPSVNQGALIAKGVDYKECGKQTAELAKLLILGEKKASEIKTLDPENKLTLVNSEVLTELKLELPTSLQSQVVLISTKEKLPCH